MWLALLLLLLPSALHLSLADPSQEMVPIFRLTRLGPWGNGANDTTGSPCQGPFAVGATTLTLANRSLERLPDCLPRALRSLDGSHNLLSALSASDLGHLPQLQVLNLRHNRIAALRWGPGWPAGLHTLDLSHNRLAALPPCARPALGSLRALELAGNPLQALPPGALACFPALRLLNLSGTALGQVDIADAAFAPLASLEVLDLSGTLLQQVQPRWIQDLPKLTSLYLRKMPMLRSLEGDIFKMASDLQQLDCQDSRALTSVQTHIFQSTPRLQLLLLQNCNLSSFPPWTLHSSQVLSVNLFGNPLTCSCELSWLLMDVNRTILSRAADTVCAPAAGPRGALSAPLPLSRLPGVCRPDQSTALLDPSPPISAGPTRAPSTPAPFTPQLSTAPSSPAGGGRQAVTKAPSHAASSPAGAAAATAVSIAGPRNASAASRAWTEHDRTAPQVPDPPVPAASIPPTSKQRGLAPASRNPPSTPRRSRATQATPRAPRPSLSEEEEEEDGIPVLVLDDSSEEEEEEEEEGKKGKEEEAVSAPPRGVACDYHPCKHLQTPCAELQRRSRCQCPGFSQEDTVPDPPKLQGVSEITDTSALVRWCAPNSVVRSYQVRYAPEGAPGNQSAAVGGVYATARLHPLYGLSPGTTYRVCVLAANRAGLSPTQAPGRVAPCASFTTKPSFVLVFAGLCAAGGLLLVSTLVLSACLWRRGRRQSYQAHPVAYKNPAFDHPLKLQTFT